MEDYTEHYRKQFFQEAAEILEKANEDILRAEGDPEDGESLHSVFRGIHTIKGSAGSFDLQEVSDFTHHLEGLLDALRSGRVDLGGEMVDAILAGMDHIGGMLRDLEAGREAVVDEVLVERFLSFYKGGGKVEEGGEKPVEDGEASGAVAPGIEDPSLSGPVRDALEKASREGLGVFLVRLRYSSEHFEHGYDPLVFLKNLKEACSVYYPRVDGDAVPSLDQFEPLALYLKPELYVAAELSREELADLTFDPDLVEILELAVSREDDDGPGAPEEVDPESLREFLDVAVDMVESLEKTVIEYERSGSSSSLNEIFRIVHNVKGDADYIGLSDLAVFCHALESLLEKLRSGKLSRTPDRVDVILRGVDYLRRSVSGLAAEGRMGPFPSVFRELEEYRQEGDVHGEGVASPPEAPEEVKEVFIEQALQYRKILVANLRPLPLAPPRRQIVGRCLEGLRKASDFVGLKTLQVCVEYALDGLRASKDEDVLQSGEEIVAFIDGLRGETRRLGEILVLDGKITEEDLRGALARQKPIGELLMEEGKTSREDVDRALKKQSLMEAAGQLKPAATGEAGIRTMRIDERKVEQFTNMVGELLIARNTYDFLLHRLEGGKEDLQDCLKAFKENLHLFSRLTNDIHHGVMALRMIPLRGIFQKFTRVVRDIGRRQKKTIELMTDGEDIEIDKKVADTLSDPLVHLIRNACDHGIENVQERRTEGKPEKGTLLLRASREGSCLNISVIDDGRGISKSKLHEKSREMGMDLSPDDDGALMDLIFMPGFSTKSKVSDISGRGVGMDVVKTTVQSLGGNVRAVSEEGKGTEITLSIPTTLGIDAVLLVEAGERSYAIPLDSIVETLKLPAARLKRVRDQKFFHYRGRVLMAEWLTALLDGGKGGFSPPEAEGAGLSDDEELSVVVVNTARGRYGIVIDELRKNLEVAIKPLPGVMAGIGVVSGVSIMGDGKVLLVLNPENLHP